MKPIMFLVSLVVCAVGFEIVIALFLGRLYWEAVLWMYKLSCELFCPDASRVARTFSRPSMGRTERRTLRPVGCPSRTVRH